MGPLAALESVVFKFFRISGRASRSEFWWWFFAQPLFLAGLTYLDVQSLATMDEPSLNPFSYLSVIFTILALVPNFTVTIRRLHDTGRSGFWYLIVFIPIIGAFWFIVLMLLPSERDDNIYGPPWRKSGDWSGKAQGKSDPMQGYRILDHLDDVPSPDVVAARKQEVRDYYKSRVLQSAS